MKIGLIEMMVHEGPEKATSAKDVIREWSEDAQFIFVEGEEYQRALDGLLAAGAIKQKSGKVGHRTFDCLDLVPLTVAREQYKEMERDLDGARKAAMRAEAELQQSEAARREVDRQYHDLTVKLDELRGLLRQAEGERESALRRAEEAERALSEAKEASERSKADG